jgi:hypothetical protein
MNKVTTKSGVVSKVERLNLSTLGNPNWLITFEDGTSNRTSSNQSISYWIGDHVVGKMVSVRLTPAGRITDVSVVRRRPESYGTIWVCHDCLHHHANGECGGCHDDLIGHDKEPLSAIEDGFHVAMGVSDEEHSCGRENGEDVLECDCETNSFSMSQCEGCGTYLYGERHAMTLFKD